MVKKHNTPRSMMKILNFPIGYRLTTKPTTLSRLVCGGIRPSTHIPRYPTHNRGGCPRDT